ncbi:MAG: MATE family efflux transporter [Candidatus Rokuibacteriota bacterium]
MAVPATTPTIAVAAGRAPAAARTRQLLEAPIVPTLLRLAAPNVVVLAVQTTINVLEAYFVGWLGTDALAGVSLVFPLIMLMQTMSAGGMGGGVASAIARALGAGRREDANALVVHALLIATGMAALFTGGMLVGGPVLFRSMGGRDGALAAAVSYSTVIFSGAVAFWMFNTLGSIIRGTGNMILPAAVVVGGGLFIVPLSPALIFGIGPVPSLGVTGAGLAVVTYYVLGSVVFTLYLASGRGLVRLSRRRVVLRWAMFRDILRVGLPGAFNTVQANLTQVLLTAAVGAFGTAALAGYGMGARLEYLQIPLVFGMGSALVTMVGTNMGAGQRLRARRVAWVGAAIAAAVTAAIGLLGALAPQLWLGMFSSETDVLAAGATYLRIVGPTYGFFGLGLALYFASQGAGHLLWPVLGGAARLLVAAGGGWFVVHALGGSLAALCGVMALAFVIFGSAIALALRAGVWR